MAYVDEKGAFNGLAAAVVIQAAEDYGNLLLGNDTSAALRRDYLDAKRFLESDDLHLFTRLDGDTIKHKVEELIKGWPIGHKFSLREG